MTPTRQWMRVSRQKPCPVCKRPDWCGVTADGELAICMRVESARQSRNGGWLHRLKDAPPRDYGPPPVRPAPLPVLSSLGPLMAQWRAATPDADLARHAADLGVTAAALRDLGAAYAPPYRAWAFPMRDGSGKVVGVRLRAEDGRKWAIKGSREGLFYPETTPADHVAWVCEGPTDTAAGLTMGLWVVGRPSCAGAVDHVNALFRRLAIHRAVIVADRDDPKRRPDGSRWRPGSDGAARLGAALRVQYRLIFPGAKDLRAWVQAGATGDLARQFAEAFPWRRA